MTLPKTPMKIATSLHVTFGSVLVALALCATASATDVLNVNGTITNTDPTQQGRLSRNSLPQDWVGTETFPGIVNPTTTYRYDSYFINSGAIANGRFVQISLLDLGSAANQSNLFVSAYANSYQPSSTGTNRGLDVNWLGDAGFSGNSFGTNAVFFQVLVPAGTSLVIVINNTLSAGNGGIGESYNLLVESFSDNQYTDAVPEGGATALLLGVGVAGVFLFRRSVKAA